MFYQKVLSSIAAAKKHVIATDDDVILSSSSLFIKKKIVDFIHSHIGTLIKKNKVIKIRCGFAAAAVLLSMTFIYNPNAINLQQ